MSAPSLRPYQVDALNAIAAAREAGQNRLLMQMSTGLGKTVCFAALPTWDPIRTWLDTLPKRGARMLVIAHREELLDQAADKIQKQNPGLMVSIEQGDRHANRYSDVIIASIQTLSAVKFRRLKRLLSWHHFRIVVIDEAHHAAAASYRTALVHLEFLPPADATEDEELEAADFDDVNEMNAALEGWDAIAPKDRLLIGVTATPNRSDAIGLGAVFQTICYSYGLKPSIDAGWLVPIVPWVIETASSLEDVRTTAGDFNQKDLAIAVNNERRNQLAVSGWQEKAEGRSTIAFTVDVAHAHALAQEFENHGVPARAVSGETPKDDRRMILQYFRDRKIEVITNCMVLTEGTDLPLTGCILHAKPTKSATLYEQMTGRGLRPYPGKTECLVLDLVDVARRHSLQTAPVLYGLPPGLKTQGEDLRTTTAQLEELAGKIDLARALASGRLTLAELQARATTFDVWAIPSLGQFSSVVSLNWILTGPETFRLSYPWQDGQEVLVVQKDMLGRFELVSTFRPAAVDGRASGATRQRTMSAGIETATEALQLAETFVRQERAQVSRLRDREAPWRSRPASEKQLGVLRRVRAPFKPGMTMGEASDLIDVAKSRR